MRQIVAPEEGDKVLRLDGSTWEVSVDEDPEYDYGSENWSVSLLLLGDSEEDEDSESEISVEWDSQNNRWREVG